MVVDLTNTLMTLKKVDHLCLFLNSTNANVWPSCFVFTTVT